MPTFDPPGFDNSIEAREDLFIHVSLLDGHPAPKGLGSGVQRSSTDVGNKYGGKSPRIDSYALLAESARRATLSTLMFHAGLRRIEVPNGDADAFYIMYLEWYEQQESRRQQ